MLQTFKFESASAEQSEITNVSSYLQKVKELSQDGTILYRGHSDKCYLLKPSIGRNNGLLDNEEQIFLDFKKQYYLYADDRPTTDIDTLFLAQHFGLPTRLLDWTDNPLIALWFACQKTEILEGCIYTIKVPKNENIIKEEHKLDFNIFTDDPKNSIESDHLLIIPDYTNRRFLNQKGMFMWFKKPAEEIKNFPKTFVIREKAQILQELSALGITQSFVLPTLDNLCDDIKKRYCKEKNK